MSENTKSKMTEKKEERKRLEQQIRFIIEADKVKSVFRQTYLADGSRKENDAEHSWHLALSAILLKEHMDAPVDLMKVIVMVLIHDLVEIDAGDTYAYDSEGAKSKRERELKAAERIFGILPKDQGTYFRSLWDEFEEYSTEDAKFAHLLDNFQPLLLNDASDGKSWAEHGVHKAQVCKRNERIADTSDIVWEKMIEESESIVFFGGAGVSTESGIPDFRSADGIYHQKYRFSPEQVVSHTFFMRYPEAFYEFYKEKMMILDAKPNAAHLKLAELERAGKLTAVVTQNIDGLHQLAGSKRVYELHGSIHRNYCMNCGKFYDAQYVKKSEGVPKCSCGGVVKPDVVLYEEGLDEETIRGAVEAIASADMLLIGGTSLVVYPAAGFIDYFRGSRLAVINKSETAKNIRSELTISAPIGEILSRIKV